MEDLEKQQKEEIMQAIKDNTLYDFICSNSYRIDNYILKDLLLECIATLEDNQADDLLDNLIDYKEW